MIRVLPVFDDLARFILDVFEDLGFVQLGHCQKKFWIVLENPSESSTTHEEQQNIQLIESITTKFSSLDIVIHYKLTNPLNATDYDNPYYEEIKEIEASKSFGFKILALKFFFSKIQHFEFCIQLGTIPCGGLFLGIPLRNFTYVSRLPSGKNCLIRLIFGNF